MNLVYNILPDKNRIKPVLALILAILVTNEYKQ